LSDYLNFITGTHDLYARYVDDWRLAVRSYWGGVEYRDAKYLKRYSIDDATPSEVIRTYDMDDDGRLTGKYSSIAVSDSKSANERGEQYLSSFYLEKLQNVPLFPYTRLYVSEYNSILFRNTPVRELPELPDVEAFINDVDGEGNSINEFVSMVDIYTTVYGVVWTSCIKPLGSNYARWRMFSPIDVPNWKYSYTTAGDLELSNIVLRISSDTQMDIFQYITKDTIDIVFVPKVEELEVDLPDEAVYFAGDDDNEDYPHGYYVIQSVNELGYIPVEPVYQSNKIYNGIGHTPIFDIAQIQRSIYGDSAEIYSSISYGAHPVNIVDEDTAKINDGALGAEPGTIVRVPASIGGTPNYVFEFRAPPLDSIKELRELIDQKIDKMNQVAMIRTEDLIRASRSGAQIEQYDSKLEAFIRKKATCLENWEYKMWIIWFDWLNKPLPTDLTVSYNRLYSSKGLTTEIAEVRDIMSLISEYESQFAKTEIEMPEAQMLETDAVSCAPATGNVALNLANRQTAIDTAAYGPLNPSEPNDEFWQRLADKWSVTVEEAKQSRCGNCAAFNITAKTKACIQQGLAAGGATGGEWDTISAGDLGYCEAFDFKCASARTCDAWVGGGPITDTNAPIEMESNAYVEDSNNEFLEEMKEKLKTRMKQLIDSSFSENSL